MFKTGDFHNCFKSRAWSHLEIMTLIKVRIIEQHGIYGFFIENDCICAGIRDNLKVKEIVKFIYRAPI